MLKRLRYKLWSIRYHSANRERTVWTAARDWSLAVSLALAIVALFVSEVFVARTGTVREVRGKVYVVDGGPLAAAVDDTEARYLTRDLIGLPTDAEFAVLLQRAERGWPFASADAPPHVQLDLNILNEVGTRTDARLAPDDPHRAAITAALRLAGHDELVALWRAVEAGEARPRRSWLASLGSVMVWWLILLAAANVGIILARAGAITIYSRHADRAVERLARGRCPSCDYDLRGLEYSDRCPECGELVD
ncbi:MAG: hypothetical protein GY715_12110 [Planctomycetes bacterium]|nr:hypothetical protein [Planctomycetota bacterium]